MTPLYILMLVCPITAATPHECVVGLEKPLKGYETQAECDARAKEIYDKTAHELYQVGAVLRVGCVDKSAFERITGHKEEGIAI